MELRKTFRFEASHILPKHPGKCSCLHGHSWVLHVSVRGPVDSDTGFVQDYADISSVVKPIIEQLDHKHLGAWEFTSDGNFMVRNGVQGLIHQRGFYPSSENLLVWIAEQLHPLDTFNTEWSSVALEETCTSYALLTREEYRRGL